MPKPNNHTLEELLQSGRQYHKQEFPYFEFELSTCKVNLARETPRLIAPEPPLGGWRSKAGITGSFHSVIIWREELLKLDWQMEAAC